MPDDPYPRAEVEDWPDVPATDPEAAVAAYEARVAQLRRILALAVELGAEADPMVELADDAEVGSYQIGVLSPIGALDRQRLLTAPGPQQRLDLLEELLDDQELMLRARLDDL
jgi:hypothetical protein